MVYQFGQGSLVLELSHADAENITKTLFNFLEAQYDLTSDKLKTKLAGFGSDGASVMTGRHTGISARLHASIPSLVSVHCVAHKLALAASGAASDVSVVSRFKALLNSMFHYLHQSPARSSQFIEVQRAFNLS